jgi:Gpi18-like mannosyltransferase
VIGVGGGLRRIGLICGAVLLAVILAYQFRLPMEIKVGERSADPFVNGFSFREQAPFGAFRWSGAEAKLFFTGIGTQDGVLGVRLGAPQGQVRLWANGHLLTPEPIGGGLMEYTFPVQRGWLGPWGNLMVTLQSQTFTSPPDTRQLGAQVGSASFESLGGLVLPAPLTLLYVLLAALVYYAIARAWSGSAGIALAVSAAVILLSAWGLASARLEAAWLVKIAFWLGLAVYLMGWLGVWLLRRFYALDARTLRLVGLFCFAAFVVRLPFAVRPGLIIDVQDYVVWSYKLTTYGLGLTYNFTENLWIPDYPPVLLYAFTIIGHVYQKLFSPDFLYPVTAGEPALRAVTTEPALLADPIHRTLLRMPAILADLLTGALIYVIARRKTTANRSLAIASAYWFNPLVIYNSAVWGQTDAAYTLFVVLAVALVELERAGWGFFALVIGGLTKPQAFVFGPLLLLSAVQRQKWRGLLHAALGGAASVTLVMAPILVTGAFPAMLDRFAVWAGQPPHVSLNALNLWFLVRQGNVAVENSLAAFDGVSFSALGLLLFAAAYGLAILRLIRRRDRDLWAGAAYVGLAFFCLATGMHENYSFAVLALLAPAIAVEGRFAILYAALTLTMVANYALYDPDVWARFAISAPDAQLLSLRWATAAITLLIFAAWTAWEVVGLHSGTVPRPPGKQPHGPV